MNKLITIRSEKDYNKFLNRICLYKSIFFYNIFFKLDSNIENEYLIYIINSLNIKNRKYRTKYIYDKLCSIIDNKMDLSICQFKNNKCIVQQKNNSKNYNGCCLKCIHQKNGVCDTKNLSCKLFYCTKIKKKYKIIKMKDIPLFKLFSLRQKIILKFDFFESREEVLKNLNSLFLIITLIKMINRNK